MKSLAKGEKIVLGVTHKTSFSYTAPVFQSHNELRMSPLDTGLQRVLSHRIEVDPATSLREHNDHFGNRVLRFNLIEPHNYLHITATSEVETTNDISCGFESSPDPRPYRERWVEFLAWSPAVPFLAEYETVPVGDALDMKQSDSEFMAGLLRVAGYFHSTFSYQADVTNVYSTPKEFFANKAGVCQDMAHALIGVLRLRGIPARYVSGYVLDSHDQPDDEAVRGSGATHAWVQAWHEAVGWIGVDPTNNKLVDWQYVRTAVGRDYFDIQPIRGVFQGTTEQQMTVSVEVKIISS